MKKIATAATACVALSGCALPVPIQIALLAADGISLLESNKSLGDHGLSIVTGKDCAMWRILPEGRVCRNEDPTILLAETGDEATQLETPLSFILEDATMRSLPSGASPVIRPLRTDEIAERLAETDDWVMVRIYDDANQTVAEGWVDRKYLQDVAG